MRRETDPTPVSTKTYFQTLPVSLKSHALRIGSFQGVPFEPIVFTVSGIQINMQGTVNKYMYASQQICMCCPSVSPFVITII